jgi:catechol 2,3-dioxygenase-like lactoylglutathione lyase family enzyme
MKIRELNHIAIHVTNVDKSSAFYRSVLQLESLRRPAFDFPGAWFRFGVSQELHLIGDRGNPVFSSNRGNHFALMVDDIDQWANHLHASGADFAPKKQRPDGAWQIFLRDPDGHVIELFTPPSSAVE